MSKRLSGRKVIITGGAAGIGFTAARIMVREGAAVALLDLDGKQAEESARILTKDGGKAIGIGVNVADAPGMERAARAARDELGIIDGLFNNAGIAAFGGVHDSSPESWQRMWDVNVIGTYLASKVVLPDMIAQKKGAIVNVGSVAGMVGIPNMAAYCTVKGAVISLTRQMAVDYAKYNVRVNCVNPGTVADTAMGRSLIGSDTSSEAMARRLAKYPAGRFAKPEEIAEAVVFLLSDDASFCCGSILAVDGGMTAL